MRVTKFSWLVLLAVILASGLNFAPSVQAQSGAFDLSQFDLLTETLGWIVLDGNLFITSDSGQSWSDVTPSMPSGAVMQDVQFIDAEVGWALSTTMNPQGGAFFHLARTSDGGATWTTRTLPLFVPGEIASYAERTEMGWLDAQTGWMSVKQFSGSNFSIGTLFVTSDGGETWIRSALPIAGRVVFTDPQNGWVTGGPAGDQIFKTQNSGVIWQNVSPEISNTLQATAYPPFVSNGKGLLVTTNIGAENSLNIYRLDPSSGNWSLLEQVPLDVQPGVIGLSILDAQNFAATIPGTSWILRMAEGQLDVLQNQDGLSDSIVALDMISLEVGWAKSVESSCVGASLPNDPSASVNCSSTTRFLRTTDGGRTWQNVTLPSTQSGTSRAGTFSTTNRTTTMNSLSNMGNSQILTGQGFDACEIPTLSQMQTWASNSPYKAVNLYIGGSSRACDNLALDATYLRQLYQQGWKFIPTWVGPQAPCTGYLTRMSSDPSTAYTQGVTQADLAVDKLAELGLTFPNKTGSVVYYDIEYYGTNTACREAVNSFMNGWVSQIHARGNLAGVYASPACNTGLSDFRTIATPPDAAWIAAWYYNIGDPRATYDPTASVWDWLGNCMPNTAWPNHQRVRQYSGDHNETWGGLTLEIDNDVLDGVVAIPFISNPPQYIIRTATPRPRAIMKSQILTPFSLTTQFGTTNGSLSSLSLLEQSGTADDPDAYVSFQTPGPGYFGNLSYYLPTDTKPNLVSSLLLQVNFKSSSPDQIWTWSIYNWQTGLWINLGDTIGLDANQWNTLVFRIRNPQRYISPGREIRIQLKSDNTNGDAKIDYEALHITYLSLPGTPTPVVPVATSDRPGIFSVPISTPRP